jgi:hypothetical protein
MTPKDVLEFVKSKKIEMVDLKFMDFVGTWQHFAVPVYELKDDSFEEGFGFDGSSIRGWQPIHASDMLVIPEAGTAVIDPFITRPTLSLICNIVDPITKENYTRDPRNIARKAEAYLKSTGIADQAYFGPEAEFFIFDDIRFATASNYGYYYIDSEEGVWNSGREEGPNLGYKPRHKEGYFPVSPTDSLHDLRDEMVRVMESPRRGRRRSTCGSTRWSRPPTRCSGTSTSARTSPASSGRPSRSCRSRSTRTTEAGCTRTSRCGRAASRFSRARSTADSRSWRSTISAGSSSTLPPSAPSPTRR